MNDRTNSFWKGRKCLVTGGLGCGGSHLCAQLLDRGALVYTLDRLRPKNSYLVLTGLIDRVEYIHGDIRDLDLLKVILERYEINTVFHLAAQPIVPLSNVFPFETLSINALGTYAVLEAVRTASFARNLIFASSGAYYGTTYQQEPISEDQAPLTATSIYSPSKVAGDIAVRCYAQAYDINAAVCRFINTYGPGNTNFNTIVPRAIQHLIEGTPYDFGARDDGSTVFDYMHISDMIRGYLAVAENIEQVSGEAFNFGPGNPISVRDLVQLISRLFDGKERQPIFGGPKQTPRFVSASIPARRNGYWAGSPDLPWRKG